MFVEIVEIYKVRFLSELLIIFAKSFIYENYWEENNFKN
jgi:hypothetical protein